MWKASYYNGKNPVEHFVTIEITPQGLKITAPDKSIAYWNYKDIRQTQGAFKGEVIKIEKTADNITEAIVVKDRKFSHELFTYLPKEHTLRFFRHDTMSRLLKILPIIITFSVLIYFFIYTYVLPKSVNYIANKIPIEYEENLGKNTVTLITSNMEECDDEKLNKVVENIFNTYENNLFESLYTFKYKIVKSDMVNAFAAPGGYVVIFTGLIEKTKRIEELAGVIAHEMQHVTKKHSLRNMIRSNITSFFLTMIFGGDLSSVGTTINQLQALSYSRELEEESDKEGAYLMSLSGIDIKGMADFFETLSKESKVSNTVTSYFSTHPDPKERSRLIREIASTQKNISIIKENKNWDKIKKTCAVKSKEEKVEIK